MNKINFITLILVAPFTVSAMAAGTSFTPEKVSAALSLGLLNGEAKESAYDPSDDGRRISQLDWKYTNATIIKGNVNWDFSPWVSFGVDGWTTFTNTDGHMDDYDWMIPTQSQWTHHSSHPDTKLNYANQFDLNLAGWLLNDFNYRFGLIAGYQQSSFSWRARGGSYNYNNGANIGTFPNVDVIGYSQKFKLPYIGIAGLYRYQNWETSGSFKFSNWGKASGNDEHYLRALTFKDEASGQRYYGLSADVGYYVTNNTKIFVEGAWNRMVNVRGDTTISGYSGSIPDGSGIENTNYLVAAGLKYTF